MSSIEKREIENEPEDGERSDIEESRASVEDEEKVGVSVVGSEEGS